MNYLKVKIISPEKLIFDEETVESITLTTSDGELTILPGHKPLISRVIPGEIVIRQKGKENSFVSMKGFLKLDQDGNLVLIVDYVNRSEDIEIQKVEEAKKRAEKVMQEKISQEDFAAAQFELTRTLLELKIAKRRKGGIPRV